LRKTAAIAPLPSPGYKVGNFPFARMKPKEEAQLVNAAAAVGLHWHEDLVLWQRDKEVWLFPAHIEPLIGKVRFSRPGIKLAESHNKGYAGSMRPSSPWREWITRSPLNSRIRRRKSGIAGAMFIRKPSGKRRCYRDLSAPTAGSGEKVGSRLKNSYPRELVRDGRLFASNT
jgi:16S rRNA (cytosine1407-C5)-methyltransferase